MLTRFIELIFRTNRINLQFSARYNVYINKVCVLGENKSIYVLINALCKHNSMANYMIFLPYCVRCACYEFANKKLARKMAICTYQAIYFIKLGYQKGERRKKGGKKLASRIANSHDDTELCLRDQRTTTGLG